MPDPVQGLSEEPRRIQLSRAKGWKMPENTVKVDRTTVFGNPWTVAGAKEAGYRGSDHELRGYCVRLFREFVEDQPGSLTAMLQDADFLRTRIRARLRTLRGKHLACWCPLPAPGEPDHCHASVLLELANPHQGEAG
jgi:hypothetical protein